MAGESPPHNLHCVGRSLRVLADRFVVVDLVFRVQMPRCARGPVPVQSRPDLAFCPMACSIRRARGGLRSRGMGSWVKRAAYGRTGLKTTAHGDAPHPSSSSRRVTDRYGRAGALPHRQDSGSRFAGRQNQWTNRGDRSVCGRRCQRARLPRTDPAQSLALSGARPRLRLLRLWFIVHAERHKRTARHRRWGAVARARAAGRDRIDETAPRRDTVSGPDQRAGPARRRAAGRPAIRWGGPLRRRAALAWRRSATHWPPRQERAHWPDAGGPPPAAVL